MYHVNCEKPRIIVNRNLPELLARFGRYFFNGHWCYVKHRYKPLYKCNLTDFNKLLVQLTPDNYMEHFVVDSSTGQCYPIYHCVPCGHCNLCKENKINSFVQRIKYESFSYSDKPLFITLTYDDKWYPDERLSIRDCQLFFKRFRINLKRSGFSQRIRYALVGELGKRTKRGHYHAIIFGLPTSDDVNLRRIETLLRKSWSLGFIMARTIDMSDSHTAYYTAKYMRKPLCDAAGNKQFLQSSSRRNGGLGSAFFREQAKQLRKRCTPDAKVLNPWSGAVEPLKWSKYALDKIYPSEKTAVPLKLRKSLREYLICYHAMQAFEPHLSWLFDTNYKKIVQKFRGLVYEPFDGMDLSEIPISYSSKIGNIYEHERVVLGYLDTDFSQVHRVSNLRNLLLSNLQFSQCDVDLVQRVAHIKRNWKRLETIEQL